MLENYKKSLKERADLGIPPLPLSAEQTSELVELIKKENNTKQFYQQKSRRYLLETCL